MLNGDKEPENDTCNVLQRLRNTLKTTIGHAQANNDEVTTGRDVEKDTGSDRSGGRVYEKEASTTVEGDGTRRFTTKTKRIHKLFRSFAPGRVNLIGEHVDYMGGHVYPAAIEQGVTVHFFYDDQVQDDLPSDDGREAVKHRYSAGSLDNLRPGIHVMGMRVGSEHVNESSSNSRSGGASRSDVSLLRDIQEALCYYGEGDGERKERRKPQLQEETHIPWEVVKKLMMLPAPASDDDDDVFLLNNDGMPIKERCKSLDIFVRGSVAQGASYLREQKIENCLLTLLDEFQDGCPQPSVRVVVTSTLPMGAGLSSSSALCSALMQGFCYYFSSVSSVDSSKQPKACCGMLVDDDDDKTMKKTPSSLFEKEDNEEEGTGRVLRVRKNEKKQGDGCSDGVHPRVELVKKVRQLEVLYSGVKIGIMDQFVAFHGERNSFLDLDCGTLRYTLHKEGLERIFCCAEGQQKAAGEDNEGVLTTEHYTLLLANSMAVHSLGDEYNYIRDTLHEAEKKLRLFVRLMLMCRCSEASGSKVADHCEKLESFLEVLSRKFYDQTAPKTLVSMAESIGTAPLDFLLTLQLHPNPNQLLDFATNTNDENINASSNSEDSSDEVSVVVERIRKECFLRADEASFARYVMEETIRCRKFVKLVVEGTEKKENKRRRSHESCTESSVAGDREDASSNMNTGPVTRSVLPQVAELLSETHAGLAKLLRVSTEQIDLIHHTAMEAFSRKDIPGGRLIGGGFGGCVMLVIRKSAIHKFQTLIRARFLSRFDIPEVEMCCVRIGGSSFIERSDPPSP